MFSNKNETNKSSNVLVVTIDNLPDKKFKILGIVTTASMKPLGVDTQQVVKDIQNEAYKIGADAVIGFKITPYRNTECGYGTAIKYMD